LTHLTTSLAWAEIYLSLAKFALCFNFKFVDVEATDFVMESDQYIIGTKGKCVLKAHVIPHKG
jgi:hypothetical protein